MATETPQLTKEEIERRAREIREQLAAVRQGVDNAVRARNPPSRATRLVAVSKTKPASDVQFAYDSGQRHFGENYVQELVAKAPQLPRDIQWHFIGHLQSNKCKMLADIPNLFAVETVDSLKLANTLDKACSHRSSPLGVFIQVNTSGEPQKGGIEPAEVVGVAKHIVETCKNLRLLGLMTIGLVERDELPNPDFVATWPSRQRTSVALQCLASCREEVLRGMPEIGDLELSMGMSSDYVHAIELGSTNVRVGSTIFGARHRP
ncbi:hypothetical protein DFJ74DRAFT_611309 [Hyaloraphidium curvatum]|nr:hypothetical protein DFJ74DRAFT_611309 [Hyaloraphidium curvatum]